MLGAVADRASAKKRFLLGFAGLGVLSTAGLYWVGQGEWGFAISVYAISIVGFAGANVFYDALLLSVAAPERVDYVSSLGYALGYLGGGLLFLINVAMTLSPNAFGIADATQAVRLSFLSVALWWGGFTLFTAFWVPERALPPAAGMVDHALAAGFRQLAGTLKKIRHDSLKISQPSTELPLTGTLTYGTDTKATTSGADRAPQAISYHHAPGEFAEGRQVKQTSPVKDVIGLTDIENTRDKTPRKNLGYYRSRQAIPIRTLPRFAAATLREIDSGVPLNLLAFVDSWAEVELPTEGLTGFVRGEFLIPVAENKSLVTRSSPSVKAISEVADSARGSAAE